MPATSQTSTFRSFFLPSSNSHSPISPDHPRSSSPFHSSAQSQASSSTTPSSSRANSPAPINRSRGRDGKGRRKIKTKSETEEERLRGQFGGEAYKIHNHLTSLSHHLQRIRPAYLADGTGLSAARRRRRPDPAVKRDRLRLDKDKDNDTPDATPNLAISTSNQQDTHQSQQSQEEEQLLRDLESLPYLTEQEKDEVELRAKVLIRGCGARVGGMEGVEKARQALHSSQHPTPSSLLSTFLPSLAPSLLPTISTINGGPTTETQLSAHHASIILYLNTELLRVSGQLKAMGEERWKRRVEKGRTLGGMVGSGVVSSKEGDSNGMWNALGGGKEKSNGEGHGQETWKGVKLTVPTDPSLAARAAAESGSGNFTFTATDDPDEELPPPLTDQQIQQYSSETSQMLESMSSTLDSALLAEQSLLEIASLQTSLITHLQTQTESINLLYDDAIGSVGEVERANVQLKKAKERGGSARLFLLVFLIGSSMALLFLDYYSS